MRRLLIVGVLVAVSLAPSRPARAQAAAEIPRALTDLNDGFQKAYSDAKSRMLAGADPVIVAGTDTVTLLSAGRRTEASMNTPLYHTLKSVAHIPLAIFVTLMPDDGQLAPERLATLDTLRALIPPARASLASVNLPAALAARQNAIIDASVAFIDEVRASRAFSRGRLAAFLASIGQPVAENTADATRAQLDALHAQVTGWRRELSPAAWDRLHVVVVGAHMPRDGSVVLQYFSRLLHEPAEGRRIIYAESLWEEPRALDLLGTHLLDGSVGEAFFGDFMRMHRDLLADAGADYLQKLLPQ
jgi:hypothetical protein